MEELFIVAKKIVDSAGRILLVSHQEVDGDALGSMLGLKIAFESCGKEADIFSVSQIPETLNFLPGISSIKKEAVKNYDLVFGVDYGDINRLETIVAGANVALPRITFDHHPLLNQAGDIKIVSSNFSATCEIVYHFLCVNCLAIDKSIATCLLTGIFTDTWSFRHPNTTAQTLKVVASLLAKGASLSRIARMTNQNNFKVKAKIWGKALTKIVLNEEIGFVFCFLSIDELFQCDATPRDLSGLASLLCMVPGAKFSLVLSEVTPGHFDGSLRALPGKCADVSLIAKKLGGGGHKLSAGFKTKNTPDQIIKTIKELIVSN